MPTRSGADPGGSRASGPLSRWLGTSGNKVGVGSILRTRAAFFFAARKSLVAEGVEVAVAITRLAKHEASISLFVRFVKNYIRFLFAMRITRHTLVLRQIGQVTLATEPPSRAENLVAVGVYTRRARGERNFGENRHPDH